jgi:7,8-dihydropterin-6-yl-methyl-4-(beta-D-ribofuranosyl)aminobenzene 5'-phosphate synthase
MKRFKISILVEDTIDKQKKDLGMSAKHGLSIHINRIKPQTSILMDTGQSPEILLNNMKILDLNLDKIDVIFLSHGHYDHTGGLLGIYEKTKSKIPLIAHPDVFSPKFKTTPHLKDIGCPSSLKQIESNTNVISTRNPVPIADGIITTGEVKRTTIYEKPKSFWTIKNEIFVEDMLLDDQSLILNIENKGLVILSGCAHSGIINTIKHAQLLTGIRNIHGVIGGFHLKISNEKTIKKTIEDLVTINPSFISPCHCTGSKSVKRLSKFFGKRYNPLKTGDILEI